MKVYCISEFKEAFEKLSLKNPYRTLERDIIDYFFDKTVADLRSGVLLNNNYNEPYIKKRLNGRGGFRVYYLLIIKNDCLYLMYLHPKAGPDGADNIKDSFKAESCHELTLF
jgi:hypothetical protein